MTEEQKAKVLVDAISGTVKVYQENSRWVFFIIGLPEWVNLEINRHFAPYDIHTQEGTSDYIKLVQESIT